ncbi:transcriptional regulator [Actinosynnema pretiosum]|uniref:transcriptional regulator n=1 Tax=Actinosynnema pretiosum TaxID=42197 RepID=UPI001E5283BF|nr:transcriptional regulator [Actinosynnema pretiosum]
MLEQKIRERRMTLEEFAAYAEEFAREHGETGTLGLRHLQRLVAGQKPNGDALGPVRQVTARLLESIFGAGVEELLAPPVKGDAVRSISRVEQPARSDVDFAVALDWLDGRAGWAAGTSRVKVRARMAEVDAEDLLDRRWGRAQVRREQLVRELMTYYGQPVGGDRLVSAVIEGWEVATTILSRTEWLRTPWLLDSGAGRMDFVGGGYQPRESLSAVAAGAAVDRLAEAAALGVRLTNLPLYRLVEAPAWEQGGGVVGTVPFAEYALTGDLLENELVDAVAARRGGLPLRDEYLPDLDSVLDVDNRVCAGGVLALCAIARPADRFRGPADYALLVQERSGSVLNAAGRLAVIPKGFHQPLNDLRGDASIRATLVREMEEELFGRCEVDTTLGGVRAAAPMHPGRCSEPMRWLTAEPERLRLECTGFGFNLVSGNYEFAGLVVIEDEEFWPRFGGQVEANWEAAGLRLYSSLDSDLITELVRDEAWSNEGLFALLQGLRRLREIGGQRVDLPSVEFSGL